LNGSSPEVPASTAELSRALRNLLENAIRHTPFDGSVCIEAGIDGDRAYVSVADECGGIPDGDLDRVFDLAFRGAAARTPGPDGGAGLGLAIARGIAEAHHGDIMVRNENGGCRFTLRLPLEQPA
jgi:signal transduction histidine kinase